MEEIKIYSPQKQLIVDEVGDDSFLQLAMMSDHKVTIVVETPYPINFTVGCYLDFQGIRYTIRAKSDIQKDGNRRLEYTIVFESPQADSYKRTVRNPADKKLKFPFTASPKEHLELIVWNLNQISPGWQVGEYIEAPQSLVSYNHTKCWDAIKTIADTFNTEFEFDCYHLKVHLRKVEYNKDNPLRLAYGRGNGFKPGLGRKSVDSRVPIEILAVQAGSKNIDVSKNNNHPELFLPKGQTISFDGAKFEDEEGFSVSNAKRYIVDAEGLTIQRADKELVTYEDSSTDLSNIYPMRVGTITAVEVTEKGFYNVIDSTIPQELDYSKYRIAGEEMVMIFQKAEMLSGREFKIMQDKDKLTGYKHAERKFMLVSDEQDGQTMPNNVFSPKVGDTYAVFGMMLPDEYIREDATKSGASWDMFREAVKVLYEEEQEKFSFTGELDGKWAKSDWVNIGGRLGLGYYIRFTDDQIIESEEDNVLIRITGTKTYLNNPYSPEITLANVTASTYNEDFRKIPENEVKAETDNKETIRYAKRGFRQAQETLTMLQDSLLDFSQGINPITVQTMAMLVGDDSLQFRYVDSKTDPKVIAYPITYDAATKQLHCPAGIMQHMTLGIKALSSNHKPSDYKFWDMEEYISANLADDDLKKTAFYLYAKCAKIGTTGSYLLSKEAINMDADANNYHFLVGILNTENEDDRSFVHLYGFTEITPGRILAQLITSHDGNFVIDLAQGLLEIFNQQGKSMIKLNGEDGSGHLAGENLVWDALSNLLMRGRFETNKNGAKIIIDPTTNKLSMANLLAHEIMSMSYEYQPINQSSWAELLLKNMVGSDDWGSIKITPEGITQERDGQIGFSLMPMQLILGNPYGVPLNVILKDVPISPAGLEKWQLWADGEIVKIKRT